MVSSHYIYILYIVPIDKIFAAFSELENFYIKKKFEDVKIKKNLAQKTCKSSKYIFKNIFRNVLIYYFLVFDNDFGCIILTLYFFTTILFFICF